MNSAHVEFVAKSVKGLSNFAVCIVASLKAQLNIQAIVTKYEPPSPPFFVSIKHNILISV